MADEQETPDAPKGESGFTPAEEAVNQARLYGEESDEISGFGPAPKLPDPGKVLVAGLMTDPEKKNRITGYIWVAVDPPEKAIRGRIVSFIPQEEMGTQAGKNLQEFARALLIGSGAPDWSGPEFLDYWYDHQGSGMNNPNNTRFADYPVEFDSYTDDVSEELKKQAAQYDLEIS